MVDENDVSLKIEIKYGEKSYNFETEKEINYDDLVEKVIAQFEINENQKENLEFKYTDEDEDINILRKENDDIFDIAREEEDGSYSLKLNLNISDYKNNLNLNEKNPNNKINNKDINETEDKEEDYKNKHKIIEEIFRRQILNIKKDFNKIIEKKIKNIEQDILQSRIDIDIKKQINNKHKHNINNKNNINLLNSINEKDEKDSKSGDSSDENENNNRIIMSPKKNKNKFNKKENNINEDFINIDNNDDDNMIKSKNNINFDRIIKIKSNKGNNKDYKKIKSAFKTLFKKTKEYESEITKNGNTIKETLDKKKISQKDMNDYYNDYIERKQKEDKFEIKDSIYYCIILRRINLYLEKSRITQKIDNYFILEEVDKNNNNLDLKNININDKENENENGYQNKLKKYLNNLFKKNSN